MMTGFGRRSSSAIFRERLYGAGREERESRGKGKGRWEGRGAGWRTSGTDEAGE